MSLRFCALILLLAPSFAWGTDDPVKLVERVKTALEAKCTYKVARLADATATSAQGAQPKFLVELFEARAARIKISLAYYTAAIEAIARGEWNGTELLAWLKEEVAFLNHLYGFRLESGTGAKDYDKSFWYPHLYRDFQKKWGGWLRDRLNADARPTHIRIVGTGRSNGELRWLVTVLEAAFGKDIDKAVGALDLRFHLYDNVPEILNQIETHVAATESASPWIRGRTSISYFDLTVEGMGAGWTDGNTALVVCRNNHRHRLSNYPRFFREVYRALGTGGMFLTDVEAASALDPRLTTGVIPVSLFREGTLGLPSSDDESVFYVKPVIPHRR